LPGAQISRKQKRGGPELLNSLQRIGLPERRGGRKSIRSKKKKERGGEERERTEIERRIQISVSTPEDKIRD